MIPPLKKGVGEDKGSTVLNDVKKELASRNVELINENIEDLSKSTYYINNDSKLVIVFDTNTIVTEKSGVIEIVLPYEFKDNGFIVK